MRIIHNTSTEPAFNLALEEYILTKTEMSCIILWRNSKAVIIGCNQNAAEEMDMDYIKQNDITVIRRMSGGGAVFHDLGNINFTVIQPNSTADFSNYEKFTAPICAFLRSLGVDAQLKGRNDLVIGDLKFSGNAQTVKNGRIMHHGTILYNADFSQLASALKPRDVKIQSKGIKSVRSRVTNVADHLPETMSAELFLDKLLCYFTNNVSDTTEYNLSKQDISGVNQLVLDKYSKWDWNFGHSPDYDYEKTVRFDFGIVEVHLKISAGVITNAYIFGDFFGILDKSTLENKLVGVRHQREDILEAVKGTDLSQYIHGISTDQFCSMF